MKMQQAYLVDAVRTPIGRYRGALRGVRADDMMALVLHALLQRHPGLPAEAVEDVIAGDANQAGEDNRNVARMAALLAGMPVSVPGNTVNRLCGSGLQAVMDAARAVMCGEGDVYLAGGVESMTRAPWVMAKPDHGFGRHPEMVDSTIGWRFPNKRLTDKYFPYSMGQTAEEVARRWNISREEQDRFALGSHEKYFAALEAGKWKEEIVPVEIASASGEQKWFCTDEHPRRTSLERMAGLRPAFVKGGTVTAGNSSGINDGAVALLVVSQQALERFNLKPVARVASMAVAGVHPDVMGIGPVPATQKALRRAGIAAADLDLIELNEAFASQCLACMQELDLPPERVNVNGGAIAIGHPLGSTGARVLTTLLHEMRRRPEARYGLATLCVGLGQGMAMVTEKV
jgi:3-oxoadipyl-CoA thiolase